MPSIGPVTVGGPAPEPGSPWALRRARPEDLGPIAEAELALFPGEAWSPAQLAEEIAHPSRDYVVAAEGEDAAGPLLGYAGIMVAGDVADLHTIGTLRPGAGIGRALLRWCEEVAVVRRAERMLLEVREDNDRARTFYARAGYVEIGRRPGYYRLPDRTVDALVMERRLRA